MRRRDMPPQFPSLDSVILLIPNIDVVNKTLEQAKRADGALSSPCAI
jgi:hypothetical protein